MDVYTENWLSIYLDNNVIIDVEKGFVTIEGIIKEVKLDYAHFFYSLAHIYETDTIKPYSGFSKEELVKKRLSTISKVSGDMYMRQEVDKVLYLDIKSPFEVYESIKDYPFVKKVKNEVTDINPFSLRRNLRTLLKLDSKIMNNLGVVELINYLNEKYEKAGLSKNFTETIFSCYDEICEGSKLSLYDKIAVIIAALDDVGFWKDKETDSSDAARIWDSNHCYYAAQCDVLVTNDRNMKKKAEVAYYLLDVGTRVININELNTI